MGLLDEARLTVRLALGVACVQACEYRDPKPEGEPGLCFDTLHVQDSPASKPRPIRCTRKGDNYLAACSAIRCPIAAELEPLVGGNLVTTAAGRLGIPSNVVDVVRSVGRLIGTDAGGNGNGQR